MTKAKFAEASKDEVVKKNGILASIGNLKSIQEKLRQVKPRFVVIVIPDKSTVYRTCISGVNKDIEYPDISPFLQDAGVIGVNLLDHFRQAVIDVLDLYLPNDTHLSAQGYQLMMSRMADEF